MKIITLQGNERSGKATVLKDLIEDLQRNGTLLSHGMCGTDVQRKRVGDAPLSAQLHSQYHIWAIFGYGGKKVCITTQGDYKSHIEGVFLLDEVQACDIFICAIRSKGDTVEYAQTMANGDDHYTVMHSKISGTNTGIINSLIDMVNSMEVVNIKRLIDII